ncbi:unnamed protein product [Durusdinium trenchii]|uniref:C2 domain-containing protein n=1 Tax=Durusdinium trenchii TaxID=1381693 RepID=A0ABP0I793_9DINO
MAVEALLGDPRAELDWNDFAGRLLTRVRTPWLTRQGVAEIFAQLQVRASGSLPGQMQPVVRVPDLVQALLGSEDFALEAARRVLRVVAREAGHREQDVGKLCLAADTRRVGSLNLKQLSSVLLALCPGMLAEADVGLIFWRFSGSGGFSYEQLQAALKEEQNAAAEHLLLRGMPELISKAAEFQAAAKVHDAARSGSLSATQLSAALSQLNLFAQGDRAELENFVALLAPACKRSAANFDYATLVPGGVWKGPSVEEAVRRVCGDPEEPPPPNKPAKRHLLAILYYKTAEASKKLGLSRQRAFEGLDRGNKGFLTAEDLRAAVLQVVGGDETLTLKELGLPPATRLNFPDFEKRLNFDFTVLGKHIDQVFGDQAVIPESDFVSRLYQLAGIDRATSQTWIQLMYPEGLPEEGLSRGACDIFLATTPSAASVVAEGAQIVRPGPDLRAELLKDAEVAGTAGRLPSWVASSRARSLLKSRMSEKDAEQMLQLISKASAKYPPPTPEDVIAGVTPGKADADPPLRSETLLVCTERAKAVEHVLEVSIKSVEGFSKASEVFLRYFCHGTACVADVPVAEGVDFQATHVFGLTAVDGLEQLFEHREHAVTIQAWIAVAKHELRRPLSVAVLPAAELRDFLRAAFPPKPRPEAVLGSQKKWTLSFEVRTVEPKAKKPPAEAVEGSLELVVHYRRRPAEVHRSPLPWNSSFAGRLVVCRPGVATVSGTDPEEAPSGLMREVKPAPPPPGSVIFQVKLQSLLLQAEALRGLVARCLQGQVLPAPGSAGGLATKAPQLFARLCLFPGKPKMQVAGCCGWVESPLKPVPETLLLPASAAGASKGPDAEVRFDFAWSSPALEPALAVEALQDGHCTFEVWIRHPAADLRLSETQCPLQGLLEALSPEETNELRLRTLQPCKLELSGSLEREGKPLAQLKALVELQLPNGPGMLSWLVEKKKPKDPEPPMRADYHLQLKEVILSGDFVAHLANEEDLGAFGAGGRSEEWSPRAHRAGLLPRAKSKELPLFYLEMEQGSSTFRSAPLRGAFDGFRWIRIACPEDTALPLPGRLVVNGGPEGEETRKRDAQLLRGDAHRVDLKLVQIGSTSQVAAQAEIQLPIGWYVEGVPAIHFGGHLWATLRHVSPERPWSSVVGRALMRLEAMRPRGGAPRLWRRVPLAPAAIFLPLYKDWLPTKVPSELPAGPNKWPLEDAVRLVAGEELWKRLMAAEARRNALPSGAFQALLRQAAEQLPGTPLWATPASPQGDSAEGRMRVLQEDLAFLSATIAPMMADAEMLLPYRQLLLWMSLRALARWVLPVAEGLLECLSRLDGEERGRRVAAPREASGAVSLGAFQSVLQAELARAGLADLPAALWQLITDRPEWQAGGPHFDYLLFLWDLQAACGESVRLQGRDGVPRGPALALPRWAEETASMGTLALTIHEALHLPQITGHLPPNAFVSYAWRCEKGLSLPLVAGSKDSLGSTKVVDRSCSPSWSHSVSLELPEVTCGDRRISYPEAFRQLFLELWVWHAGRTQSEDLLMGGSEISLVPLKSGYDVDGYFHILPAEDLPSELSESGTLSSLPRSRGQLRVSVSASLERMTSPRGQRPARVEEPTGHVTGHYWPFRPAPGKGPVSSPRRPVLTMNPLADVNAMQPRFPEPAPPIMIPSWQRPLEPPLPDTWGCPRGPLAQQLWTLGLRSADRTELPGVKDDVSETALRAASKLSETEVQLRSLAGDEEEQLRQLRARHQENLESLGLLQKSMLAPDPISTLPSLPLPEHRRAALDDLQAAATGAAAPLEVTGLSSGPLPRAARVHEPASTGSAGSEAVQLLVTAGPLPPPSRDHEEVEDGAGDGRKLVLQSWKDSTPSDKI